ncbi:uncharacterized protein [Anas platyrhynchos]|uniref:uncharacterized protein n=1 Tax=Anas platyrhynchos TaxID=8839 RepID=UPI003AF25A2E
MGCDLTALAAYIGAPSEPGPAWLVPGLPLSICARLGVPSKDLLGDLLELCCGAVGSCSRCPSPQPVPAFPRPCLAQAAGAVEGVLAAVQRTAAVAAVPARGSSSPSAALPSPLQRADTMGSEAQDITCSVCQGVCKEPSYILPCLHQFCFGCVMRWAERSSTCPLCRQRITSIRYSIWAEDDFLEVQVAPDAEAQDDSPQDEQGAAEPMPQPAVRGLPPEEWAALFREHLEVLGPLRSWVRQQARELFDAAWWDQDMLEATVVAWLCRCGLDEHALVRELRPLLQGHTVSIVQRLISIMGEICSEEYLEELGFLEPRPASQLYMYNGPEVDLEGSEDTWEPELEGSQDTGEPELEGSQDTWEPELEGSQDTGEPELEGSQDTWEPEDSLEATPSPAASPRDTPVTSLLSSSSAEGSDIEELPSTSSAALPGGPAPIPEEQEELFSEPEEEEAEHAAVPGCSHGPSPPGQGRDSSPGGPRRAPKRRADSNLDSPQPCKRPPHL